MFVCVFVSFFVLHLLFPREAISSSGFSFCPFPCPSLGLRSMLPSFDRMTQPSPTVACKVAGSCRLRDAEASQNTRSRVDNGGYNDSTAERATVRCTSYYVSRVYDRCGPAQRWRFPARTTSRWSDPASGEPCEPSGRAVRKLDGLAGGDRTQLGLCSRLGPLTSLPDAGRTVFHGDVHTSPSGPSPINRLLIGRRQSLKTLRERTVALPPPRRSPLRRESSFELREESLEGSSMTTRREGMM